MYDNVHDDMHDDVSLLMYTNICNDMRHGYGGVGFIFHNGQICKKGVKWATETIFRYGVDGVDGTGVKQPSRTNQTCSRRGLSKHA